MRISERISEGRTWTALAREAEELDAAARRMLQAASKQLRSGRSTWEPWFEAGMELHGAAKRLKDMVRNYGIGES